MNIILLFFHKIHEKTWISRNEISPDEHEYRDIRVDYPGIENVVHQEELGYKKSKCCSDEIFRIVLCIVIHQQLLSILIQIDIVIVCLRIAQSILDNSRHFSCSNAINRRSNNFLSKFVSADMKTVYLIMYNLYQFIAYFYIVLVLSITLSRDGFTREISKTTYKTVGPAMKCNQILQYLEFLNALVGYTKGSPLFPFLQVTGRNFVLFAIIHVESRIQEMPVVFVLFMVWSLVELIRYPYYIISLVKKEVPLLTWLRYTVWIVLYPLGFLCEGTVLLRSLPFFEETKRFTVEMPNKWNFTFDMVAFMKIYMGFILLPGLYIVMKHMTKLRTKKLKKPIIHRTKRTRYD